MFEQMLGLVKNEVAKKVGGIDGIPAGKQPAVVETAASSLMDGLKKVATPDKLALLLGGGSMVNDLSSGVVSSLTSKLGLSPAVAQTIAGKVVPAVTSLFKKHVDDPAKPEFNISSIAEMLSGGGQSKAQGLPGALMDNVKGVREVASKIFGKK